MEQLTIFDFVKLYGEKHLLIAESFGLDEKPFTFPHAYKKMIEVILYHAATRYGQKEYQTILKTYNQDVSERFKNYIDAYSALVPRFYDSLIVKLHNQPFTHNDFLVKDEYSRLLNGKDTGKFSREDYLEEVFTEAILDFSSFGNPSQPYIIENQKKTSNGTIDILVRNEHNAVIFELKKGKAKRKDVYQVHDYSGAKELDGLNKECVLVANAFDDEIIKLANSLGVSCISYQVVTGIDDPYFLLLASKANNVHANEIFNRYFDEVIYYSDEFDGHAIIHEFLHPGFKGNLKEFYLNKINELNKEIRFISEVVSKSKQILQTI
jgi:hypothetical protein